MNYLIVLFYVGDDVRNVWGFRLQNRSAEKVFAFPCRLVLTT